jgi:hypothetical protein
LRTVGIPLKAISPAGSDKQSNARAVSPMFQAGRILLPSNARWADQYIESMTGFPKGTHDDVDSTSQALNYLRKRRNPVMEFYERELAEEAEKNCAAGQPVQQAKTASAKCLVQHANLPARRSSR